MEYLPYVRGDIIVSDAKYSALEASVKVESFEPITVPTINHKGEPVGTCVLWLPFHLLGDLNGCGLWPTVMVDENGESQLLYIGVLSFVTAPRK